MYQELIQIFPTYMSFPAHCGTLFETSYWHNHSRNLTYFLQSFSEWFLCRATDVQPFGFSKPQWMMNSLWLHQGFPTCGPVSCESTHTFILHDIVSSCCHLQGSCSRTTQPRYKKYSQTYVKICLQFSVELHSLLTLLQASFVDWTPLLLNNYSWIIFSNIKCRSPPFMSWVIRI